MVATTDDMGFGEREFENPSTTLSDQVPLRIKIGWGLGGMADNYIMNMLVSLYLLVYVDQFGLSPVLAGIALFIPRMIDALTDPLMGNISDNWKSRWGRRRPFIAIGAVGAAILLPFLWTPVFLDTVGNPWFSNGPFWHIVIVGTAYAIFYTIFVVPYTALGYELTNNYDERTRTLAWRMYIGLMAGFLLPWIYRLTQLDYFKDVPTGTFYISILVGLIIVVTGVAPAIICREDPEIQVQKTIPIMSAMSYTMKNRSFMILFVAFVIIIFSLFAAGGIGPFIIIYYLFNGDKEAAATLGGWAGSLTMLTSYFSMFLISPISMRWSKMVGMNAGLGLALFSTCASWFAIDPRWPYAMLITTFGACLGLQGCWLMISSMIGDICDEDEIKTGLRREGMFSAVNGFAQKIAFSMTSLIGGWMLAVTGFDEKTASTQGVTADVASMMKAVSIGVTAVGLIIAFFIFLKYPITREMAERNRRILEERKNRPANAFLS